MDEARLKTVRSSYSRVEICSDAHAVLGRPDIAAVIIATPAPTHAALAIQALEAGKDVGERLRFESDNAACPACDKRYRQMGEHEVTREAE
jgi:hypothetical protein